MSDGEEEKNENEEDDQNEGMHMFHTQANLTLYGNFCYVN